MTLPSRHIIRSLSPEGLRSNTPPLGQGSSSNSFRNHKAVSVSKRIEQYYDLNMKNDPMWFSDNHIPGWGGDEMGTLVSH